MNAETRYMDWKWLEREVAALADEDDDAYDEALTICLQLYVCMLIFFCCVREILYEIDRHLIFVSG